MCRFRLELTSETVEVSATASPLQTESGAVQDEVTGQQVSMQELNGRNPLYMAQLIPGVRGGATMGDFNFAVGSRRPVQRERSPRAGHAGDVRRRAGTCARAPMAP